MMRKAALLFFIFTAGVVYAQKQGQERIDSILKILPRLAEDTNKVKAYNDLSATYWSVNPEEGIKYGKTALELATKLNWEQGMAYACGRIGVNYGELSDNLLAMQYHFKALRLNEKLNNKKAIAGNLNNIGNVYMQQLDYPQSLEYYKKALAINKEIGNTNWAARNLGNIGNIYWHQKKLKEAKENYKLAIAALELTTDKNLLALNYSNLGNANFDEGEYKEAIEAYLKSLKICRERGDRVLESVALGNLGGVYLEIVRDTNKKYLNELFKGDKKVPLSVAKRYLDTATVLNKELGTIDKQMGVYLRQSEVEEQLGNTSGALQLYKAAMELKDSLFSVEKSKNITETAMKFEYGKKEAIAKIEQEKQSLQERNIRNLFLLGFISSVIIAVIILLQRNRIKKEKAEVEKQKHLIEEKQKEILDSIKYAKRIQTALMPTEKYVERNLNKLRKL